MLRHSDHYKLPALIGLSVIVGVYRVLRVCIMNLNNPVPCQVFYLLWLLYRSLTKLENSTNLSLHKLRQMHQTY
jgi:hypothetical protein